MYELWEIKNGTNNLIDQQRDPSVASSRAIEESNLRGTVIAVIRQGFGEPLYYAYRGVLSGSFDTVRRLSVPAPVVAPAPEEAAPVETPKPRRRREPDEFKARGGKPDIVKQYPTTVTAVDDESGVVEAIVNVFGIVDDGDDVIHSGAFTKTLAESGSRVTVLDSHNMRSALNVIGKPLDIREVGRDELPSAVLLRYPEATGGLYTKTQYLLNTPEGRGVFERIKAGALNEYSIGFDALQIDNERQRDGDQSRVVRHIRQVRLWEYSPVVFGMNPATATVSVKTGVDLPDTGEHKESENDPALLFGEWMINQLMSQCAGMLDGARWGGLVDELEQESLTALCNQHLEAIRAEMPQDIALRPMVAAYLLMSGNGADETKVGRVLSERNYNAIKQAHELLTQVMDSAGLSDGDTAEHTADKSRNEGSDEHATDGPSASTEAPTSDEAGPQDSQTPATTQADLLHLIEQRLAEVEDIHV